MFRETYSNGMASAVRGDDTILRHPDGSIDFAAYRAAAGRERKAAIRESVWAAARVVRGMFAWIWTAKSGSPGAKHQPHHAG